MPRFDPIAIFFPSLSQRQREPEVMDQPGLAPDAHQSALSALARINRLSRSSALFWPSLKKLAEKHPERELRVLDIACGGGDVTISLERLARRAGLNLTFSGCDKSDLAIALAQQRATSTGSAVHFFQCDVLQSSLPLHYDAIICSLFLHHLDEPEAERLLHNMAHAAGHLVLVNDLARSRWGYLLAVVVSRLLTRSHVVHVDGPLSVQGAFTPQESLVLAELAGCTGASVSRHWPERFLLQWWKS